MADDPYFGQITLQLIEPPPETRAALDAAAVQPVELPPGARFHLKSAQGMARALLKPAYQPPAVAFVAFPKEAGRYDVLRAEYPTVDNLRIHLAQTKYLIVVAIKGLDLSRATDDAARAELAAEQVLAPEGPLGFESWGAFRSGSFGGRRIPPGGRVDEEWAHWLDRLRWWVDGDTVGFVTLKASGGPTREIISPGEEYNRSWF